MYKRNPEEMQSDADVLLQPGATGLLNDSADLLLACSRTSSQRVLALARERREWLTLAGEVVAGRSNGVVSTDVSAHQHPIIELDGPRGLTSDHVVAANESWFLASACVPPASYLPPGRQDETSSCPRVHLSFRQFT